MAGNRVVVTGADSRYFGSLITLLSSLEARSPGIGSVIVYDLGLSALEKYILKRARNVSVRPVPPFCDHYLQIENFAWKTAAICDALEFGGSVLWLDAGVQIESSLDDLFETIERDGYLFTITPLDHPNCRIGHLSHDPALQLLDADNEHMRNSFMVNAGVMGYLSGHAASEIALAAKEYAANPEIIVGPRSTHRHDQTIYSVLRVRHNLRAQFNIFNLPNVERDFPFLIAAVRDGIVAANLAERWKRPDLHIYLLITRDRRQFCASGSIVFVRDSALAILLVRARMLAGGPASIVTKRLNVLTDRLWRRISAWN